MNKAKIQAIRKEAIELHIRDVSRTMKIKILFAGLLMLASFTAAAQAQTPDKAKLDRFFDRLAEKNKAMGSLVLARDGNVLYARTIGYSQINGGEKKPLTTATRFRVGSITKMFTAAMIFQLVEEKKLKLDDTLDKFFPQIPNADKITVAHVLAHRSGIRDVTEERDFKAWAMTPRTKDELVAFIAKGTPDFEPDQKYSYSNTGYILLGYIIEKVGGKSYQEALKKRITSKIGLKDTYVGTGNVDVNKNESFSYRYLRGWERQPGVYLSHLFGSGALISTPNDLVRFIQALFDGKIISKQSLASMKTIRDGSGLGIETFTYNGKTFYGHTGGIDNFGAWLAFLPEEKLALAYTSNAKVYPVSKIVSGVFDIYYDKPFQIPAFDTIEVSPEILDKYVGVYSIPGTPVKFTVTRDEATLYIQMTGQSALPLEAMAQDKFGIESAGIVFEFDAAKNQMIQKRGGRERVFTKEK